MRWPVGQGWGFLGGRNMTRQDVLTVEQVSEILGISRNTIQRRDWREKTGCPLRKIGKRLYILVDEFHKWMERANG